MPLIICRKNHKMGIHKTINPIELSSSTVDDSPVRAVFCLKKKIDMKKIEEVEDCFILDFDPSENIDIKSLSLSKNSNLSDDADLSVLAEKGQVACRDYPHPRHLCVKFPFDKNAHDTHCKLCFCYVCDIAAPCKEWKTHCNATDNDSNRTLWRRLRDWKKKGLK